MAYLDVGPKQLSPDVGPRQSPSSPPSTTVSPSGIATGEAFGSPALRYNQVVSPGGIASGEAFGTATFIFPQAIQPGGIASGEAFGSPNIVYPRMISPGGIGTGIAFGTPSIAGPIIATLLGPARAWFAPVVKANQTLTPAAAIAGARSIPSTAAVRYVQTLRPAAAFAHTRSWPSPTLSGGHQYIVSIAGLKGPRRIRGPVLTGGDRGTVLLLSGIDRSPYLSFTDNAVRLESQTIGRWKLTFALEVPGGCGELLPAVGETVQIIDYGRRLFAGCMVDVALDRYLSMETRTVFRCVAADKSAICDHRVVTGISFATGDDVAAAILTIASNYLNGEGIDTSNIIAGTLGTFSADPKFNFPTVTGAFDQIAGLTGLVWWIDVDGFLTFTSLNDLPPAPFGLTETSDNWRPVGGSVGLKVSWSLTDYYNKLFAVSNLNVLPGAGGGGGTIGAGKTETFTWQVDAPGTIKAFDGAVWRCTGIVTSSAIASVTALTVNGIPQTFFDLNNFPGPTPTGPPDYYWQYLGAAGVANGITPGNGPYPQYLPPEPSTVVITYIPYVATSSSAAKYGTALRPAVGEGFGTCGSGWFEGVVQVKDISTQESLDAIAEAALSRIGGVPRVVMFETDYAGLAPGQALSIDLPLSGIPSLTTLITQVAGIMIPGLPGPDGGTFRWTVEARSNLDPGNWIKWYERLIARTANPLPVLQYEECTFVLGAGSALSGGVSVTNPYIVGRTGKVVELLVAAATPPVGQDLVLTVYNGAAILSQITLPAGTPANVLVTQTIPASVALYVFARDVLNVSASYSLTGGATTNAQGVTLKVRWAM